VYKLVIVDDEPFTLEGMTQIIDWNQFGVEIVGTAMDGAEGLEVILNSDPDIVLADISMPEMDGLEMIDALRKADFQGKIIIMSAYQDFVYAQKAIELKIERYLTKPIETEELERLIGALVSELNQSEEEEEGIEVNPGALTKILADIDKNYGQDLSLSALAERYFYTVPYMRKLFKQLTGMKFVDYITKKRVEKAKELLMQTDLSTDEISALVGYKDVKHFRIVFKKLESLSPSEFRRKIKKG